jgi:putative cell wall-binding protein
VGDLKKTKIMASMIVLLGLLLIPVGWSQAKEKEVRILVVHNEGKEISSLSSKKEKKKDKYKVISVPEKNVSSTLSALKKEKDVAYAEVDQIAYTQSTPNDPYFSKQIQDFTAMKITDAWENYELQEEVTVAVVDSGVDLQHPDLKNRLVEGKNFINEGEPPMDSTGHGTHVAGTIGAVTNNKSGIASPAIKVKVMPVKVFEGKTTYMSTVIEGIRYSADHGADIINLSLGSYSNMKALEDAIGYAVNKGILVVGAAGNDNEHAVLYPANYPNVLGVGSIDSSSLTKSDFSNYGEKVNVSAPGTNIFSTWINGYRSLGGTSMATAMASSVSSLVKQQYPFLTGLQVKEILENSSTPLPEVEQLGKGLINAQSALNYVRTKNRLSGHTSVDTSVEISKNGWDELEEKEISIEGENIRGKFVILASGRSFPDSLAASPLAAYLDSPILLVKKGLSPSVQAELKRLNPSHVLIIGGKNAVSNEIEHEINELPFKSKRVKGIDRYETAVAINELIPYSTNKAFVVSGQNYPDALSVAAYSGSKQYPVLFVQKDKVPASVMEYMTSKGITKPYVVGGTAAVGTEVTERLQGDLRISGKDRFETNYKVHELFSSGTEERLYFATGWNFPDALSISALAARTDSPVILVDKHLSAIKNSIGFFGKVDYHILGGTDAIPIERAWRIDEYINR